MPDRKYEEMLVLYDEVVASCPRFERKGKTMAYTSANGHMFSLLNKNGELGFRYAKDIQAKYLQEFNTTHFKSYGATMRGYVLIPEKMLENIEQLCDLLNESYDYVMSLSPK